MRVLSACALTAVLTAAVTAGAVRGSGAETRVKTIPVGATAIFAKQDLICVNEAAGGAPPVLGQSGIGCSSHAQPYRGIGVWVTRKRLTVVREPSWHVVAAYRR